LTHAIQKLYSLKASEIYILFGNLLLRESPFHIVNYFELFFVYTLKLLRGHFWHICA